MRRLFLYTSFIFCLLLEVLLIYSYLAQKINTKEFLLIGLGNIGVIYVFILNIKHNNKKAKTILNDQWRNCTAMSKYLLSSSIEDWRPVRQYTPDLYGFLILRFLWRGNLTILVGAYRIRPPHIFQKDCQPSGCINPINSCKIY